MLGPEEFTVGDFPSAMPSSLILPRTKYEALALICEGEGEPVAVFLAGQFAFEAMPSAQANNWGGVIVPNVRLEVDHTSLYDSDDSGFIPGVAVRQGRKFLIRAKTARSFGRSFFVQFSSGLSEADGSAAFSRWQVVVGTGENKRTLHVVDAALESQG